MSDKLQVRRAATVGKQAATGSALRPRSTPLVGLSCLLEWLVPGAGYLVLGRPGRAAIAALGIGFLFVWGLVLGGSLDRPRPGLILSYLATFACTGSGLGYFLVAGSESLRGGIGNLTSATHEYGTTFLRAAGLIGFLLVLDVYDIAVGRKS